MWIWGSPVRAGEAVPSAPLKSLRRSGDRDRRGLVSSVRISICWNSATHLGPSTSVVRTWPCQASHRQVSESWPVDDEDQNLCIERLSVGADPRTADDHDGAFKVLQPAPLAWPCFGSKRTQPGRIGGISLQIRQGRKPSDRQILQFKHIYIHNSNIYMKSCM